MVGEADDKDRHESRKLAAVLIALVVLVGVALLLLLPSMADLIELHFAPGVGLKQAAIIAFFVTVAVMLVFALVAGDGLLGELQFILTGFFLFFVILWLMIAWVF